MMVNIFFCWLCLLGSMIGNRDLSIERVCDDRFDGKQQCFQEAEVHPFYVSVVEIEHNIKAKTAEVSIRIFAEDLETTLRKFSSSKLDIGNAKEKSNVDKVLNAYIQNKLQLNIDGKSATMHYLGFEKRDESIWTYLEVPNVATMKKITINCSLLYDFQEKQINLFHIKEQGKEKSDKLDFPTTNLTVDMSN